MRIRIVFQLKNRGAFLPFYHQHLFNQLISDYLGETAEAKDFNFSGLKGQTRVSRKGLHFCSKLVTLVFSSLNEASVVTLLESMFADDVVRVGHLELIPEKVERELEPEFSEVNKFICISPIVLTSSFYRMNPKQFINPETEAFSDLLYESTMNRMQKFGLLRPEELSAFSTFQLIPDKRYLEKIRAEEKKFARIYTTEANDDKLEIRGYTFPFILYAAPKVQSFIFNCGFGELTDQGFGMLDLAHSDPTQRSVPYEAFERPETKKRFFLPRRDVMTSSESGRSSGYAGLEEA